MVTLPSILGGVSKIRIPIGLLSYRATKSFHRGKNVRIGRRVRIIAESCELGDNVRIDAYTHLYAREISLMEGVRFQHHVEVSTSEFYHPESTLFIDKNAEVFTGTVIDCTRTVRIGENVGIGGHCRLWTHGGWEQGGHMTKYGNIEIKKNAWLGWDIIVLPGITIGEGATVGAGSVVTKNVPDFAVVAGNPAREIRLNKVVSNV